MRNGLVWAGATARIYTEVGDTIIGDVIVCEARKISKPVVLVKSGRHKAQQITLRENAP
ncbi:MAG: hypothetical protein ACE5J9_08505 [Methanosarcinales archaeon]